LGGRENQNDGTIYSRMADQVSSNIFQIKIGNQRSIVVNSWAIVKDLWVNKSNALIDRPHQPGFVDKLGIDITGSPMTDVIKRCRQAAMRALGKPMWPGYYHLLEPSSVSLVKSLQTKGQNGNIPMDLYPYLRQVSFDLALSLTYGVRMCDVDDEFAISFLKSINAISEVRSSTQGFRHYVPILRLWPERTSKTIKAARARQVQLDILYDQYKQKVADGETVKCIVSSLGDDKLSLDEIHGTCVSLLQAAPDTVASGVYQCCAWLCSPKGQPFQAEVLEAILEAYDGDRDAAWRMSFREEKVPLVVSLYKETLRFYCPTPFATPRRTVEDISYMGTTIPKGITMIMNAQQANHDPAWYGDDATTFNPRRFIGNDTPLPHLSYGAGSRICPAVAVSNRIMSALIIRLVLAFEMKQVEGTRLPNTDMLDFSDAYTGLVAQPRSYDCAFIARDKKWLESIVE